MKQIKCFYHYIYELQHFLYFKENCQDIIYSNEAPFKRLDHYKLHEYRKKMDMATGNFSASGLMGQTTTSNITTANAIGSNASNSLPGNKETISMTLSTSLDAMFKRKRGRPPKNRVVEVSKFSYFTLIKNK